MIGLNPGRGESLVGKDIACVVKSLGLIGTVLRGWNGYVPPHEPTRPTPHLLGGTVPLPGHALVHERFADRESPRDYQDVPTVPQLLATLFRCFSMSSYMYSFSSLDRNT